MSGDFSVQKQGDDRVSITLKGIFDSDTTIKLVYEAGSFIQNMTNVKVLYDLSDFEGFDEGAKGIISVLLIQNEPYIDKEAAFGLTEQTQAMFKEVVELSGRSNIELFNNKFEAEKFLGD